MLRISIRDDGKTCRLELAGRLQGPWVAETNRAWRDSLRHHKQIEVDLRQLTWVDDAGRELLAAIQQTGACLIVEGVWMTALIGEISSKQPCEGRARQRVSASRSRRDKSDG